MALQLRDYQGDARDEIRTAFQIYRSVLLQMPTGAGKTAVAGAIAEGLAARGLSLLALVHRHELVDQFCATLDKVGLGGRYGVIAAGRSPAPWAAMQVASIQTLHRRPHLDLNPRLVVVDEAHHARAQTWDEVIGRFPAAKLLGMTATPRRLDGKPLGRHFEHLVQSPSIQWLQAHGWLAPVSMKYVGRGILTKGVRQVAGDYNRRDLGDKLNFKAIAAPVAAYQKHGPDRRAIYFAINTADSKAVAALFTERGIKAVHIDGTTPRKERDLHFREFREGTVKVLCNVDIASEGTDIPMCDCVIMGCPTLSLTRYLQWAGRAMRIDHGRDALIIDCVGNIWRHEAPDVSHGWDLHSPEPVEKEKTPQERVTMRVCVHCATVYPSLQPACPTCGKEQPMQMPAHLDVELLTRDHDEPVDAKPTNVMADVRRELRQLVHTGPTRTGIGVIRARHGLNARWEQNAIEALGL